MHPPTTDIYTLSLHDALPIFLRELVETNTEHSIGSTTKAAELLAARQPSWCYRSNRSEETRLNSSHANISYAVFCLKKKTKTKTKHSNSECDAAVQRHLDIPR